MLLVEVGSVPKFGLPKLDLILIIHLLLNIKKKNINDKKKKIMQNKNYTVLLA